MALEMSIFIQFLFLDFSQRGSFAFFVRLARIFCLSQFALAHSCGFLKLQTGGIVYQTEAELVLFKYEEIFMTRCILQSDRNRSYPLVLSERSLNR